ncbi:probable serine/threonine-protein kinase PBL7 [Rhodamnia argentea]|uniref:Probable serine/threonine-protein kinase PBL7 n=1 Tax=Rhodamnia argentea TaxID=178133 RepID=A0A8B8PJL0_9MYRT|nr:probable serine/threonine-protein kinase PBL7 [Rhodamnia argentea]
METSTTSATSNQTHQRHHHHTPPQPHHNRHGLPLSNSVFAIIITATSSVALLAIFFIILLLRRLKSAKKNADRESSNTSFNKSISLPHNTTIYSSSPDMKGGCLNGGNLGLGSLGPANSGNNRYRRGVQVFTYRELEVATEGFSERNVIGTGGYGVVYKGVLSDGTVAAIKMLHWQGKQGERAFRIEVDLLSRLHSPYLVDLLGYCADQNHRLLILEYMPHGTLKHHLHPPHSHSQHRLLDWGTRLVIALDCARALEFLHEHAVPSVIHRDFKCTNILLDSNFRARVSDFGLAKTASDKVNGQVSTRVLGTTGYLAPEYASTGKLTTKSDVYSYGVVLLELLTGRVPVDSKRPPGEHVLLSWALPRLTNREKVVEMVDPALKGHFSKKELIQVAAIAAMCVQAEADYRPLMTDVVQSLVPLAKNYSSISSSNSLRFQNSAVSPRY